ncbi:hypothetical protein BCR41DRAFT_421791 [Lobosporangium transversale]|uniref:Uncharacterized protein n=1 Tax=Lobosporangium transversale TaxID=64571 RepID=A0A1Y2GPG2_9FUNG|nr:hypothetical protein BCR41DRAFT_421791 [Lobosporangium transversale]ORZ17588.1 hypothetical protein BCR41DRAFT_421791 [Lobosporangium transversale]|eukprot:XP_021881975.1 hypothetical protein BCR41DRAFT_421791 [Lobosporangium transversale]
MSSNTNNTSVCSRTTRSAIRQQSELEARESRPTRRNNRLLLSLSPNIKARPTGLIFQGNPESYSRAISSSTEESCQTNALGSSRGSQKRKCPSEDDLGSVGFSSSPLNKNRFLKGQDRTIELRPDVVDCNCANDFMLVLHYLRGAYKRINDLDKTIHEQKKTINALLESIRYLEAHHTLGVVSPKTLSTSSAAQDKAKNQSVQEKGENLVTLDYSLTGAEESSGSEEERGRKRILKPRKDPILSLDPYADPAFEQYNRHQRMLEKGLRDISRSPCLEIGSSTHAVSSSATETVLGRRSRSETDDEEAEPSRRRQRISKTTQERLEDTVRALCKRVKEQDERILSLEIDIELLKKSIPSPTLLLLNFLESARESLKKPELTRVVEDEGEGSKPKEPQARRTSKRIVNKAQAMENKEELSKASGSNKRKTRDRFMSLQTSLKPPVENREKILQLEQRVFEKFLQQRIQYASECPVSEDQSRVLSSSPKSKASLHIVIQYQPIFKNNNQHVPKFMWHFKVPRVKQDQYKDSLGDYIDMGVHSKSVSSVPHGTNMDAEFFITDVQPKVDKASGTNRIPRR